MRIGEEVSDAANKLISQVEEGAHGPELEKTARAIMAEWRSGTEDRHGYARLLRKLTDALLEQRDAYARRAAKRTKAGNQSAANMLQRWFDALNVAIQALRDERAELKAQRRIEADDHLARA